MFASKKNDTFQKGSLIYEMIGKKILSINLYWRRPIILFLFKFYQFSVSLTLSVSLYWLLGRIRSFIALKNETKTELIIDINLGYKSSFI